MTASRTALRRAAIVFGVVAAWALVAPGARASEDGGTESVFTVGAGTRALALGGAFAAIADDASAPVWNPAGLGTLQRYEVQAMSARLHGLDISEQYGALALPSWRWGTAALVFRRFGVGGIEQRDDRNVLLSDDLSDSQTQLQLSYGRAVSEAWSGGGSLKLHRQTLAGYSAMGIGLDLGVLARPGALFGAEGGWASRFTLGMTMSNAVEPSLRLDQESVADPATFRTGFAWRQPYRLGGPGHALVSFDVAKTRGSGWNAHTGLEVAPHPLLALRVGFNDGELTAGTGVRWRLYSFDYVVEDNPIDTMHRFGLTMQFGETVADRRLAAQRRQEDEFRDRLAQSFQVREAERVRELLASARDLLDRDEVDDALARVATVVALDPENEEARALERRGMLRNAERREAAGEFTEAAVLYGRVLAVAPEHAEALAGQQRCRHESDSRAERSAQIRKLFDGALDAFTAGDLAAARTGFGRILELAPEDAEAQGMRTRTESAIRARTADLLAEARRAVTAGRLDEADELIARCRTLDARAKGLADVVTRLKIARNDAARAERPAAARPAGAAAKIEPAPPALSKKKREEIADLYERGMRAMEQEQGDDALRYWELVWLADPEYLSVADYLKREYLLRGLEAFSKGRLEEAVGLWESALRVDPDDEKTLGYLQRAREQQTRTREILGSGDGS